MSWVLCVLAALSGAESGEVSVDLSQTAAVLAAAKYARPDGLDQLYNANDGLPAPHDKQFAAAAARFLNEHPAPPAHALRDEFWTVDRVASRQCKLLEWLADGKGAERAAIVNLAIRQAARMQWALPLRSSRETDQTAFAAPAALALTGQLVYYAAPPKSLACEVGLQWARTGHGHLPGQASGARKAWAAAAEEVVLTAPLDDSPLDLSSDMANFFAHIDLDRPDMAEVARALRLDGFPAAKAAYVAALAKRFARNRHWPDIDFSHGDVERAEADDICSNIFVLKAHMYRRYDFGVLVEWSQIIDNDVESRVWMNAHPWMWTLLGAYRESGDEKYVTHLCRLFNSWYNSSPPTFKRSTSQWRTLEAGGRTGQKWGLVLLTLAENPQFQRECLFPMAQSMLDHGHYLSMYAAPGGNWLQVESSGLACVALLFPEFRLSPLFYEVAMSRLSWVNARAFLADGFQSECSPGYHRFPLIGMATALRLAHHQHAPIPQRLLAQYEAGLQAMEQIAYPDGTLPQLSDVSPKRLFLDDTMRVGAEMFGRPDFRWFATAGREGSPPAGTSYDFTHAGYCVMRDRWGADGQMLIFDAGFFGSGHQHEDKLNFVLYAGGRELIGDPGIYSYRRDAMEPYWRGTWGHNTITVDDLSQHRGLGPAESIPDPDRRFVRGDGFDFAAGWFRHAWSPRGSAVWADKPRKKTEDRDAASRAIQHQRCIFYRKGQYALVADRVLGEGQHQVDLNFQLAPIAVAQGGMKTTRPVSLEKLPEGIVVTREAKLSNVALLPAQPQQATVLDLLGQKQPARGWFAVYGIQPSHQIVYRRQAKLPLHFETVVQPLPAGQTQPLRVQCREVADVRPADAVCAAIACGSDLLLLSYTGPAEFTCGKIRFAGTAALLSCDRQGTPQTAMLVDAKRLEFAGKSVYTADKPRDAVTVKLH